MLCNIVLGPQFQILLFKVDFFQGRKAVENDELRITLKP